MSLLSRLIKEEEKIILRDFTIEQLRENNGLNEKPIYIALNGEVYDVTSAKDFYGEGNSYHCFASTAEPNKSYSMLRLTGYLGIELSVKKEEVISIWSWCTYIILVLFLLIQIIVSLFDWMSDIFNCKLMSPVVC